MYPCTSAQLRITLSISGAIRAQEKGGAGLELQNSTNSVTQTEENVDCGRISRDSGRAVYLYSTAHKTQLTILQLEDFLHRSLFPDLLPQPIGGFINNFFRELNATT